MALALHGRAIYKMVVAVCVAVTDGMTSYYEAVGVEPDPSEARQLRNMKMEAQRQKNERWRRERAAEREEARQLYFGPDLGDAVPQGGILERAGVHAAGSLGHGAQVGGQFGPASGTSVFVAHGSIPK